MHNFSSVKFYKLLLVFQRLRNDMEEITTQQYMHEKIIKVIRMFY